MTPLGAVPLRRVPVATGAQRRPFRPSGAAGGPSLILVCDPEPQSLHALRAVLRGAGFEVACTRTAAEALERGAVSLPTAAVVELALPDGDGRDVCRRLREWSAMPVILLSTVSDEEEQVRAFEAGADDYITKPFRPRELVARLSANLRRAEPEAAEPRVEVDGLEIDRVARVVRRDGEVVHLTPIEFKLLGVLIQNRGRMLTHNTLLQQVWGLAYTDARQTLRVHMANLRRKIEPPGRGRLIHTDYGIGYRLSEPQRPRPARGWPIEEVIDHRGRRGHVLPLRDPRRVREAERERRGVDVDGEPSVEARAT